MKVYSLIEDDEIVVGLEVEEGMVDFSRAHAVFSEIAGEEEDYIFGVEQVVLDENFNQQFFMRVIEFLRDHDLLSNFLINKSPEILAPIVPGKIICLGKNYSEHAREMGQAIPKEPVLFGKFTSTVIGPGQEIIKPDWIGRMDYECELALIIGRTAKAVSAEEAMNYVAGYTILNDITARDIQSDGMKENVPWFRSKNFDTFCPMGPCIVPREEIPEPVEVNLEIKINGEVRQKGTTRDFIFPIPEVIEFITRTMTLNPGDVVSTGTPDGVGEIFPGDIVEATIEPIGTLINSVVRE